MTNNIENLTLERIIKIEKYVLKQLRKTPIIPMNKSYHYEGYIEITKVKLCTKYGGSLNVKVRFIGKTQNVYLPWLTKRAAGVRRNNHIRNIIEKENSDCSLMRKLLGLRQINVESITVKK